MLVKRIAIEGARVILAFVFLLSSLLKSVDPIGLSIKIEEYLSSVFHLSVSNSHFLLLMSVLLITFEFILGSCLAMGIYRKLCTRLIFAFISFMTLLTAYNYFFNTVSDCGCFGDAIKLSNGATLLKNIISLPISLFLVYNARKIRHLYTIRERFLLLVGSLVCIAIFMQQNISNLPLFDFRPYKVGYNIKELIKGEELELQNKLLESTKYIYSKGSETKSFTSSNLPDSSWTFKSVEQNKALQDFKPKYNFELLNYQGEEVQNKILENQNLTILLFTPSWIDAPQNKIDELNYLYFLNKKNGGQFYGVSASNEEEIKEWIYQTGADYPMLRMDKTTIKTIIRGSLGLVILKNGVIIDKCSNNEIPDREDLAEAMQQEEQFGQISSYYKNFRLFPLIIWLILLIFGFGRRLLRHSYAFYYFKMKD